MSLEAAIYYDLTHTSAVNAIVATRVYPALAPQGAALPRITYLLVSRIPERHQSGDAAFTRYLIDVDCWADTAQGAKELADVVRARLDRFRGDLGGGAHKAALAGCFLQNEVELVETPADATGKGIYRRSLEFEFRHRE